MRPAGARLHGAWARLAGQQETRQLEDVRFAIGSLHAVAAREAKSMREAEFSCYSQFGEDGIIQWLVARVPIEHDIFVEFGVEDYRESNTRFLLAHDDWQGLILDAGSDHIAFLDQSELAWRHTIEAKKAFVTRDNINELLSEVSGDIGLLSIDLDGNDYWVWESIDVVKPRIVVVEFNSLYGPAAEVTIPYDPSFDRAQAHGSWLYWGASLAAMTRLGSEKGYRFVGVNRAGHNAFFVRNDCAGPLEPVLADRVWRHSRYRESRGEDGRLTYVSDPAERRRIIAEMPLVDVGSGRTLKVGDLEG